MELADVYPVSPAPLRPCCTEVVRTEVVRTEVVRTEVVCPREFVTDLLLSDPSASDRPDPINHQNQRGQPSQQVRIWIFKRCPTYEHHQNGETNDFRHANYHMITTVSDEGQYSSMLRSKSKSLDEAIPPSLKLGFSLEALAYVILFTLGIDAD